MQTRRLYYDDSFRREFDAHVVACAPLVHGTFQAWGAILDATAFYPTSGGQPNDLGLLGDANVLDVRDEDDQIVHVIDRELQPGGIHGCVNWPRRFDHMQQHTGQHLLSAMFQERFGLPTVSFHLGLDISTIDLRGPSPTDEILEGAERAANIVIFEDRSITVRYGTAEQFAEMGVRKQVERAGILRAIEIEDADLQPCGGTHVSRTGQIGTLLVRRCTKVRQDWRVEFACGRRAECLARRDFLHISQAAEKLGSAPADVTTAAERLIAERDAHFKSVRAALQRLAEAEASLAVQTVSPNANGLRIVVRIFDADTEADYPGQFATQVAKSANTVALVSSKNGGQLIFAQSPAVGKDMSAVLKQVLEKLAGKGGGTRDFARGKLEDPVQHNKALQLAQAYVASGLD
jgi:alanyl-tRNA synthetase